MAVGERYLPPRVARLEIIRHHGLVHVHLLVRHPPAAAEVRPDCHWSHVKGSEWKDEVHDRHVLAVAEQGDVDADHERGREADRERGPGDELEPVRRHLSGIRL